MTTYAEEDDIPFDVTEEVEVGDLSDQQGSVFPNATRVVGEIRKASVKRNLLNNKYSEREDNPYTFKYLNLEIKISETGIDGEGAYAGDIIFTSMMDLVLAYSEAACRTKAESKENSKGFNAQWWAKKARFGAMQFLTSLGYDMTKPPTHPANQNPPPPIGDDFLISLIGTQVMFDIKREKDDSNRLSNWRAVETSEE